MWRRDPDERAPWGQRGGGLEHLDWYDGPTLLGLLDGIDVAEPTGSRLRLPVQTVLRPDSGFRG